jgi:hypothetical protein
MKTLNLKFTPREYQDRFHEKVMKLIKSNDNWHLFSSPTGTGKSICELRLLQELEYWLLVTPRIEIIAGMLEKMGYDIEDKSINDIVKLGQEYRIYTPIRLRNILAKGELPFKPEGIILDEAHHDLAETYSSLDMYCNHVPKIGLTASPYRGNPRDTKRFLERWGNTVHEIITLKEAIEGNYFALPVPSIWPLIDDDQIKVTNGEFRVEQLNSYTTNVIDAVVDRIKGYYDKTFHLFDRPTMLAVPSQILVSKFLDSFKRHNIPACGVTQASSRIYRQGAFTSMVRCQSILVQIDVVSEGVDLPIERIIDCKPTMSPVRWIQQIGRMRINLSNPFPVEYICCCRNIERHGYLMEGYFPNSIIKESQEIFNGSPSFRSGMRGVGLEGLGKFVVTPVHLLNGVTGFMYNLVTMDGYNRIEYCVFVHPNHKETLNCQRVSTVKERRDGVPIYDWGKWQVIESIPDVKGFSSATPSTLTEKQLNWYKRDAEKYGLNPHKEVNNRGFQILPLLSDISRQYNKVMRLS